MSTPRLPIAEFPHLFLAAHDDMRLRQRMLTGLKAAGFTIENGRIIPPQDANGHAVIAAITAVFQKVKGT